MNIVNKVTIRHLKENKKRTLITLIGTIISVAMIMAVATLGSTFLDLMKREAVTSSGDWHVGFEDVQHEQLRALEESDWLGDVALMREHGYAEFEESPDSTKPYFYVRDLNLRPLKRCKLNFLMGAYHMHLMKSSSLKIFAQ
ncbi:ABC transporter permease [Geomicrobium sp. JCM 19055]|uniref:ABC transporter permease n=1 Tax=Geomicrobium sp. JCM 19055 TaxID=1460649 RepID=UPI00045ECD63|nr:ABC transporter permease [Geomicrobium sp. JCM 19055]GAJ97825.1 ABC transporter ATP-binding protein [Geomicrobium sp. JCM 19055]